MEYPIHGVTVEELGEDEVYKKFIDQQKTYSRGFVRLMPYQQIMPKDYIQNAKRIHEFNIRNDDVWISSFPKCGKCLFTYFIWHFIIFILPNCVIIMN